MYKEKLIQLQSVCRESADFFDRAKIQFEKVIRDNPDMESRWNEFLKARCACRKVDLQGLKDIVNGMEENQMLEVSFE